jgi:uncharacterized membrane protein
MSLLKIGMFIFWCVHLIPTFVELRRKLIGWRGESFYMMGYSLAAALGLTLIITGKVRAAYIPIWDAPQWAYYFTQATMLPAVILIAAAYVPTNLKRFIRHPFLWGISLWALSHIGVNGDLGSLILFGGFGAFAVFDMWSANRRGAKKSDKNFPIYWDMILIAVGLIAFSAVLYAHPYLFGVQAVP